MEERYRIYITPSARKEAKKLPKQVREAALNASSVLEKNPFAGERLSGSFHMLYSLIHADKLVSLAPFPGLGCN